MDIDTIIVHRLYRALKYAKSRLKAIEEWGEVEDHTIGEPMREYENQDKKSAKGLKEAFEGAGLEALDEVMDDKDSDAGC